MELLIINYLRNHNATLERGGGAELEGLEKDALENSNE